MRAFRRAICVAGIVAGVVVVRGRADDRPTATALLDRYLHGGYDDVVAALSTGSSLDGLLSQLKHDGHAWIDADGPAERNRRELTAATVALEAARAGEWHEWKLYVGMGGERDADGVPAPGGTILYWRAPPLLIEWACALMRQGHQPKPIERDWFLASIAVSERAEDFEFMVGERHLREGYNSDVIQHVRHAELRLGNEPRVKLAQAIAEEFHDPPEAARQFALLQSDVDLRGEATMRLGVMAYWRKDDDRALDQLRKVESITRDPWVLYLARYFTGLVQLHRNRPADAEIAFRRALEAVPRAQAATISLASLLFKNGRRDDASALVGQMLVSEPSPADPWRAYADADDRFWPELIARLRREIGR
jgi:tetratricopeptide (TPR) repeat protein